MVKKNYTLTGSFAYTDCPLTSPCFSWGVTINKENLCLWELVSPLEGLVEGSPFHHLLSRFTQSIFLHSGLCCEKHCWSRALLWKMKSCLWDTAKSSAGRWLQKTFLEKCTEFVNETKMLSWAGLRCLQRRSSRHLPWDWKPACKVTLGPLVLIGLMVSKILGERVKWCNSSILGWGKNISHWWLGGQSDGLGPKIV